MKEKTRLEKRLDEQLKKALDIQPFSKDNLAPNILIDGSTGVGKTKITRKWARDNGIHLYHIDICYWRGVTQEQFNASFCTDNIIDALSMPNTVLFFDGYDLGYKQTRALFADLMERHILNTPDGELFLPNILFSIATMWTYDERNTLVLEAITDEEKARFDRYTADCYKDEYLQYINDEYLDRIEAIEEKGYEGKEEDILKLRRRLAIANHILKDPRFKFKVEGGVFPTYVSISMLLNGIDGTKKDLLREWDAYCHAPSQRPVIEEILSDYSDIEK